MLKYSCAACQAELAAYLDKELGRRKARRVADHLAQCAQCREELDMLRFSMDNLQAWNAVEPSADFERRFLERLADLRRSGVDARPQRPGFAARFLQPLRPRFALAATVVCAALVVLAGAIGMRHGRGLPPDSISVARDMELYMNLEIIQNSEALEHFDLICMLDVFGQELEE